MTDEEPESHQEPFNWKGLLFIVIGLVIFVAIVIAMVNLLSTPSPSASPSISLHTASACGVCH